MKPQQLQYVFKLLVTTVCFISFVLPRAAHGDAPIVIAHRGASGYLPEHTLPAYALAHSQGADFIEQDLVLTRDGHLICLHDLHLEPTTNVETLFPERKRSDEHWYAIDFDLTEIKSLSVHERLSNRFPQDIQILKVPTFSEAVRLIQGLNQTTGRTAGIYPELKQPSFHRNENHPIETPFINSLEELGYASRTKDVFIQCFELEALKNIRQLTPVPYQLIFLLSGSEQVARKMTSSHLSELSQIVQGIGPSKSLLYKKPRLVSLAHEQGLKVHPYTFRADEKFPNATNTSFKAELEHVIGTVQVDGLFTDFPDRVLEAIDKLNR